MLARWPATASNVVASFLPWPHKVSRIRTHVHGTVFGDRSHLIGRLRVGDPLILVPDPPGTSPLGVWVHARGGDVLGHLPVQVADWLAPWMLDGGRARATVTRVGDDQTESWRRVEVELEVR